MNDSTAPLVRLEWAVFADTVRRIAFAGAGGLTLEGLEFVRRQLRPGGIWPASLVPESHRTQHAVLLNDITEFICRQRPGFRDYHLGAGDLLPDAPDDASALENTPGAI